MLKNAASKARFLFTGLSNTYKISVSATAHTSNISSPAILMRHSDSEAVILLAVAVTSPDTTSLSLTKNSLQKPMTMMIRYSRPPIRAQTCGEVSAIRSLITSVLILASHDQRVIVRPIDTLSHYKNQSPKAHFSVGVSGVSKGSRNQLP